MLTMLLTMLTTTTTTTTGEEAVSWLQKKKQCARSAAVALGNEMLRAGLFSHVSDPSKPFIDGNLFYVFSVCVLPPDPSPRLRSDMNRMIVMVMATAQNQGQEAAFEEHAGQSAVARGGSV